MGKGLTPIKRRRPLTDYVRDSIKDYIVENNLPPGALIPSEKELCERLGVGRNVVREGVKALESLGVLETRQGSGIYVRDFNLDPVLENLQYQFLRSLEEVREFLQVRLVLELGVIDDALARISDREIDALGLVLERMRGRAEQGKLYPDIDREFHRRLLEPAGNKTLLRLVDVFWVLFDKATEPLMDPERLVRVYHDHEALFAAARTRDAEATREALREHYASAQQWLRLQGGW